MKPKDCFDKKELDFIAKDEESRAKRNKVIDIYLSLDSTQNYQLFLGAFYKLDDINIVLTLHQIKKFGVRAFSDDLIKYCYGARRKLKFTNIFLTTISIILGYLFLNISFYIVSLLFIKEISYLLYAIVISFSFGLSLSVFYKVMYLFNVPKNSEKMMKIDVIIDNLKFPPKSNNLFPASSLI